MPGTAPPVFVGVGRPFFTISLGVTLAIGDTETVTIAFDRQVPAGPWDAGIDLQGPLRGAR
jgi:hypothetical protein